jgi:hypothetical protein
MLPLIVGLPGLVAIVLCARRGVEEAFLWAYLPTLLLLPDGYRWNAVGRFTFHEAAIIPVGLCFLLTRWKVWKFSLTDFFLLGYCMMTVLSQYYNNDYDDARNTALRDMTYIIFPYMLAKGLFSHGDFAIQVAKKITVLLAFVAVVSVYEFKMTKNLFETVVSPFFSYANPSFSFRYGLTRIAGPFGHALLAGIVFLVGYRLARWIEWSGYWTERVPILGVSAVRLFEVLIVAGAGMTAARGAWIGATIGLIPVLIGRARNRFMTFAVTLALLAAVGPLSYWGLQSYLSPGAHEEVTESEQTAMYRLNLLTAYIPVIEERPSLGYGQGWGTSRFPVIDGMASTDNHFLLLALTYGLYALAFWLGAIVWVLTRLLRFGFNRSHDDPMGMLALTLAGICTLFVVTLTTVYLGNQTGPLLYMCLGWGEALLLSRGFVLDTSTEVSDDELIPRRRVMTGVILSA